MSQVLVRLVRGILILSLLISLTGCFYWWRTYLTYLQLGEFDKYFSISVAEDFTVHFKHPVLLSEDLVSLAKLRASEEIKTPSGQLWHYRFRKLDNQGDILFPEIQFTLSPRFNLENEVIALSFSRIFLQIAPPEFLELSIRSVGSGVIDKDKRQLKVDTDKVHKINAELPLKNVVLANLGEPFEIKEDETHEVYLYYFMLEAHGIIKGYEDRALSTIKLTFDKETQEMIKMSGRFAGLKISINYRKYKL